MPETKSGYAVHRSRFCRAEAPEAQSRVVCELGGKHIAHSGAHLLPNGNRWFVGCGVSACSNEQIADTAGVINQYQFPDAA